MTEPGLGAGLQDDDAEDILAATKEEKLLFLEGRGYSPVTVKSNAVLYYKLHGRPDATHRLFCIWGTWSCGHYNDDFVALLLSEPEWADKLQVCTFDLRGAGQSSDPSGMYTTKGMAKDCMDLMDHLGWDRAHVLGASLGGMVAQELALGAPARVATLSLAVTCSSGYGATDFAAYSTIIKGAFESDTRTKLTHIMKVQFSKAVTSDPTSARYKRLFDVIAERHRTVGAPCVSGLASLAQIWAVKTHHVSKTRLTQLKNFRVPIVVIGSKEDLLVSPERQANLAKALDCKFVQVDSGHAVLNESPGEVVKAVSELLQSGLVAL